jgi:hypothetical protein
MIALKVVEASRSTELSQKRPAEAAAITRGQSAIVVLPARSVPVLNHWQIQTLVRDWSRATN